MHAVVRTYSGASALLDRMTEREDEVRELISGVPGFVSYVAIRVGDGATTVTVCDGKEGTDESVKRAAAWVAENVSDAPSPPDVAEGETVLRFGS